MVRNYESMIILDAKLAPDVIKEIIAKYSTMITSNGGEIVKTDDMGKKILAYPINKATEGYYYIYYFTMDTDIVKILEDNYRIDEHVIRHNLLVLD
ncbi:30S ribosomal protein S6 [bacterium]|nr:30S ribosomal protein S6 [bacterium]